MATAVVGNDAIAVLSQKEHLRIPGVCVQRPSMRKHDGWPRAPIFVENRGPIFRCDRIHLNFSLIFFSAERERLLARFGLRFRIDFNSDAKAKSRKLRPAAAKPRLRDNFS